MKYKARPITVKSVAYVHTVDIDPSVVKSGAEWEGLANICVTAAENALETPPRSYTPMQCTSLTDIFASMKATHRSIRRLVALGDEKPESVDALVVRSSSCSSVPLLHRITQATAGRRPAPIHRGHVLA